MELVRTVRLKLLPTSEQVKAMEQTLTANVNALNYASQVAFEAGYFCVVVAR